MPEQTSVYRERAHLVAYLASLYPSVIAYSDPQEPDWPVIYLTTPAGQLSWHLSGDDLDLFEHVPVVEPDDWRAKWDGHTTEQKYERLATLVPAQEFSQKRHEMGPRVVEALFPLGIYVTPDGARRMLAAVNWPRKETADDGA